LFDCDGVLVDTEDLKYQAWRRALDELGFLAIPYTLRDYCAHVGHPATHIAEQILALAPATLTLTTEELIRVRDIHYADLQKNKKKLGAATLMQYVLRSWPQVKVAIVSSGTDTEVEAALQLIGPDNKGRQPLVVCNELTQYTINLAKDGSPFFGASVHDKATRYRAAMASLGVEASDCVVVEDTQYGVDQARIAGVQTIFVASNPYGYSTNVLSKFYLSQIPCASNPVAVFRQMVAPDHA
jgi:beta-phosphoglucomutase-like phosphatase (HAD superfamily)